MPLKQFLPLLILLLFACNPKNKTLNSGKARIEKITKSHIQCEDNISTSIDALTDKSYIIFYLVRHAEKQKGQDPDLLPIGTERSKKLANILSNINLDMVCASPFKRTLATASPTAELQNLTITNYSPKPEDQNIFFSNLTNNNSGKHVLVVGHSNTIPKLLNHFKGSHVYNDIDESDYDNFFIVAIKDGIAEVNKFKF